MFVKRQVHPLFFVSLLFMYFAFANAVGLLDIILAFVFCIVYLGNFYTSSRQMERAFWLYMWLYIISYTTRNVQTAMFMAYLTNLSTWHYRDESVFSLKSVSIWTVYGYAMLLLLVKNDVLEVKFLVFIALNFTIAMWFSLMQELKKERLQQQLHEQNQSINLLLAENERNRIGRDLHDTLGHVFAMLSIKSELALTLLRQENYKNVEQELTDIHIQAQQAMGDVRQIIERLSQHTITQELELLTYMTNLANIQLTTNYKEQVALDSPLQHSVAMLLRELVNNIVKHAQASQCQIDFEHLSKHLVIRVVDNGKGFDKLTGAELRNVKERVAFLGGKVTIVSLKNPTCIEVSLPMGEDE